MSYKRNSLRGHLEEALQRTRDMISHVEYSAHFVNGSDLACPIDADLANDWIKNRIRLYVKTWVLPEIEGALAKVRKRS